MKIRKYITPALLCGALIACSEESDVFYSTSYPIAEITATVSAKPLEGPPTEEGGKPTELPNPIIPTVEADVLLTSPMQAGGSYTIDFTRYNGGPLRVVTAPDAEVVKGEFFKNPGADSLQFTYGEQSYLCKMAVYKDNDNVRKIALTVDLTKHYQELHPDDNIEQVLRVERTSINAQ